MKKYLSILLAVMLIFGVLALAGCSKGGSEGGDGGDTTAAAQDIPDGYEQETFKAEYLGVDFSTALPVLDGIEVEQRDDGYYKYKVNTNAAEYRYGTVTVYIRVCDDYSKNTPFTQTNGTVETISISGYETCKNTRNNVSSGQEVDYNIFMPLLDGYVDIDVSIDYLNDYMTEEQFTELVSAFEQYTVVGFSDTNGYLTADGKMVDSSRTMTFPNPVTIAGVSANLEQHISSNIRIVATATIDGVEHKVYARGDTTDAVFNSRKENTEDYTACTVGDYTYYVHMINRFPNVEADVFVEIDGVYYNFYVYRNHNLDVDANKAYAEDTSNCQYFAELVNDFIGNATVDTSNYNAD